MVEFDVAEFVDQYRAERDLEAEDPYVRLSARADRDPGLGVSDPFETPSTIGGSNPDNDRYSYCVRLLSDSRLTEPYMFGDRRQDV